MFVDDLLRRSAHLYPGKEALVFEGERLRYSELQERVYRIAQALAAQGVAKGERVAVLSGNHPSFVELYFAVPHIGAVLTTVNYRLSSQEIAYILKDASARFLVVEDRFFSLVEPILSDTSVEKCIFVGEKKGEGESYEALLQGAKPVPVVREREEEDVCFQLYTSGTTGSPKGAQTTHRNWVWDCIGCSLSLGLRTEDRYLIAPPLYHAAAGAATVFGVLNGVALLLMRDFLPELVPQLLIEERATRALLVPAMINFVLQVKGVRERRYDALETIVYGASPISERVLEEASEAFQCGFWQAYGQTESVAVLTALLPEEHRGEQLRSCGREIFSAEIEVQDEDGGSLPAGEIGEIVARGPMVMKGYYNLPEATAETLKGGWLHTGDVGVRDEKGYLYILDRKKDMIISGGENIYPAEVEKEIERYPAVMEAAVIGIPSEEWGEKVLAVVVLKKGKSLSSAELLSFCRERLARYKCPKEVKVVDALPRNPSGKVLKTVLREPYWKGKKRRI